MKTVHREYSPYKTDEATYKEEILRTLLSISNSLNIIAHATAKENNFN